MSSPTPVQNPRKADHQDQQQQQQQEEEQGAAAVKKKKTSSEGWQKRIYIPTLIAGVVGGTAGLVSKQRKAFGVANLCNAYAANCSIVTGTYCVARELTRELRISENGDLMNSVMGGIISGAFLGRLQGGKVGAVWYAIVFTCAGTAFDYATLKVLPLLGSSKHVTAIEKNPNKEGKEKSVLPSIPVKTASEKKPAEVGEKKSWWRWPEWAPIQVYDEEREARKKKEDELIAHHRNLIKLNKEETS